MKTNQIIEEQNATLSAETTNSFSTEFDQIVKDKESGVIDRATAISRMEHLKAKINNLVFTEDNEQFVNQFGITLYSNKRSKTFA